MKEPKAYLSNNEQLVLKAVDNPKYKSRTINGIAKESQLSEKDVINVIYHSNMKNQVMRVPGVKKNDKPLFVTVKRYKSKTPISVRILNMIKKDYTDAG